MRVFFVLLAVVLVGAYGVASVGWQNEIDVPGYAERNVPVLAGRTVTRWDNLADQRAILNELAARRYQPPEGGLPLPNENSVLPGGVTLDADVLKKLIMDRIMEFRRDPSFEHRRVHLEATLRDPAALYALEAKRYRFRDPVWMPVDREKPLAERGEPLFKGGELIDKKNIDVLLAHDVRRVGIQGEGDTLAASGGTVLMVMAIFAGLAAALGRTVFAPVRDILTKRQALLDAGLAQQQENNLEMKRQQKYREEGLMSCGRARQSRFNEIREKALRESDDIARNTRVEERFVKHNAQGEIHRALEIAREELVKEIPALAREVVGQTLGRGLPPSQHP